MDRFAMSVLLAVIAAGPPGAAQTVVARELGFSPKRPGLIISVDELRRPLTSKALRWLRTAQEYGHCGEHQRAIQLLRETLVKEPTSGPYAHSMLGIEYLRMGRLADALPELALGVRLLPHEAVNHSNYGYALYLKGNYADSERELQRALDLDRSAPTQRSLIQAVLEQARSTSLGHGLPPLSEQSRKFRFPAK
jgi:tetratricopeptide (TPR) repeat protein